MWFSAWSTGSYTAPNPTRHAGQFMRRVVVARLCSHPDSRDAVTSLASWRRRPEPAKVDSGARLGDNQKLWEQGVEGPDAWMIVCRMPPPACGPHHAASYDFSRTVPAPPARGSRWDAESTGTSSLPTLEISDSLALDDAVLLLVLEYAVEKVGVLGPADLRRRRA